MNAKDRGDYLKKFDFVHCDEVTKYEKDAKVGQGTFGVVFKAHEKANPANVVAIKKILTDNETQGFPITALREIKILRAMTHVNVINLIEICRTKATPQTGYLSTFFLVFDFCEHDLAGLLSNQNIKFSLGEIKKVLQQLFNGLYYIHSNKILHRDIKSSNILITKDGTLKVADFGLARAFSESKKNKPNRYTNRVVTLWYRPPELLLGERDYGPAVDIWGAACIMAEMWIRSPIMQGATEQKQLKLITDLCGSITPQVWPRVGQLEQFNKVQLSKGQKRRVKELLKPSIKDHKALDLIDKLLVLNPARRLDANDALNHDFFWTDPMPSDLSKMLALQKQSMLEYLARSKSQAEQQNQPATASKQSAKETQYRDRVY